MPFARQQNWSFSKPNSVATQGHSHVPTRPTARPDRWIKAKTYNAGVLADEATYRYDALDRTVRQTEKHVRTGTETRTTDFSYLGPSDAVTAETSSSTGSTSSATAPNTTSTKAYSYDSYGERFRMTDSAQTQNADGTWGAATVTSATYSSDPHGSVSLLLRDSGASAGQAKASYAYKPYGDADTGVSDGDTDKLKPFNPYRYTGQRFDSGSQTLTAGTRRYDPGSTRFLQQDIFKNALANLGLTADPLSQNRYALAGGNPTSFIEVDGHMLIANGGSGGSVSSNPTPVGDGDTRPGGDQPSKEDVDKAQKTEKNFDWKKELADLGLDFLGFNDVKDCIDKPSFGSCAAAIANFIPVGKIFKAGKIAKRVWDLVGKFKDWQKTRRWADDVLQRSAAATNRSDGAASHADDLASSCRLPNSYPAGTKVLMADGKRKPIEKVKPGDTVRAADPATGKTAARTVLATITRSGDKQLTQIRIDTDGNPRTVEATLTATDGHPIWDADSGRWVDAGQLTPGDQLRTADGRLLTVIDTSTRTARATVHNLSIADLHTYHATTTGAEQADILTHNCPPGPSAGPGSTAPKPGAKSANAGHTTGTEKNVVYRGLAEGEDTARGLTARAPGADVTPASHVAGKGDSPWISTSKSLDVAREKYGKHGVVGIDLSKVRSEVVDLSDGIPDMPGMLSNWARKDLEVLIRDSVPPEAIFKP
jgi:RHS repeat-associated protein